MEDEGWEDAVIDPSGIGGPGGHCIDTLHELASLGIRRVSVMGAGIGPDKEEAMASRERFVSEVLLAVRAS